MLFCHPLTLHLNFTFIYCNFFDRKLKIFNVKSIFFLSVSTLLFSCSVVSNSLWRQASLSFTISGSLLKLMSIELVMPSNHLILCCPLFLLPSILPSIRVFSNESALGIRWPKYWKLQVQHQSFQWLFRVDFLWDWLAWFPCCSRGSQKSSPTPQFEGINSSALSLFYCPALISVHDYWKNHSFDYTDLCR